MITCKLCDKKFGSITPTHLKASHKITTAEYRKKFPDAPLRSPEAALGTSRGLKGKPKSPEHAAKMAANSRRLAKDPDWLAKVRANNESRRKPKPPKKPCLCGCGRLVNRNWVSGHNGRGINGFGKVKPKPEYPHCACGCNRMTKGSKFYFSHRQYGENSYKDRQVAKQAKISNVMCKCDCGEFLSIVKVKHGHVYRHSHKPKIKPHLCECGCGKITTAPRFFTRTLGQNKNRTENSINFNKRVLLRSYKTSWLARRKIVY